MENAIQRVSPLSNAAELMKTGNMDVAKLKELLDLQERWEANEARKAYHEAMAAFKADPPDIIKDKDVAYKEVKYKHASLANVCNTINQALSKHGLTAAWLTAQQNGSVTVTCTITHIFGHREETSLTAPPDTSGSKNSIQAIGSTVTYLQRYTILALTGLATHEQDDDGGGADDKLPEIPKPTAAEQKCIDEICKHITPPAGMKVDPVAVGRLAWVNSGKYPSDISKAEIGARRIVDKKRNVYVAAESVDDFDKELAQNHEAAAARVEDSFGTITAEQKEQMGILYVLLQEKADAELGGMKIDKRALAGWVLEVSKVGYPNTADERKLIEPKASAKIIQTRLIAKASAAA